MNNQRDILKKSSSLEGCEITSFKGKWYCNNNKGNLLEK